MKTRFLSFMFCLCVFNCIANAHEYNDRIYVNSSEILIAKNGIFASIENVVYQVTAISHDSNGIFVSISDIIDPPQAWVCRKCGDPHFPWVPKCRCGQKKINNND